MSFPADNDRTDRSTLRVGSGLPGDTIDRSQESYKPSPHASRVVPPSGDVTPDGARPWPQPSLASRILVWGGIGAAAAAATAGGVLAVRKVVDAVAGDDEPPRRRPAPKGRRPRPMPRNAYAGGPSRRDGLAPRFADMTDEDRDAIRARQRARAAEDRDFAEQRRDAAARGARPARRSAQMGLLGDINQSVSQVTGSVRGTLAAVTAAIEGFRGVASQAGTIMGEFRDAAESVRSMMDTGDKPGPRVNPATGRAHTSQRPAASDTPMVDLRDDADNQRMHRL